SLAVPSCEGDLGARTYPEIGNVGVNREDVESRRPYVRGFVVREYRDVPSSWRAEPRPRAYLAPAGTPPCGRGFVVGEYRDVPSSWRAERRLGAYLAHWGIPGIAGIDTRAL